MIAANKKRGKIPLPTATEDELRKVLYGVKHRPGCPYGSTPEQAQDLAAIGEMQPLSKQERRQLESLETKLERAGKNLFDAAFEWGDTLQAIHDLRLWRESHASWEAYCLDRWGISKSNAHRQMQAAAKYKTVAPVAKKLGLVLTCESQMRPLINVPDEDIPHIMRRAKRLVAGKRITAEVIATAIKEENTSPDDLKAEKEEQRARSKEQAAKQLAPPQSTVRTGQAAAAETAVVDVTPAKAERWSSTVPVSMALVEPADPEYRKWNGKPRGYAPLLHDMQSDLVALIERWRDSQGFAGDVAALLLDIAHQADPFSVATRRAK